MTHLGAGRDHGPGRAGAVVAELPERLILLFGCLVVAVGPLTAFGQFRPYLVLPLFVVLAVFSWRLLPRLHLPNDRVMHGDWTARASGAAVLIALAWIAANARYHSELYIAVRDPAIYTLRALWLVHHPTPNVDISGALSGTTGLHGVFVDSAGFPHVGQSWQGQGASLVPALVAVFGWVLGSQGVLNGNLVIGALGLLAVYALARRIVGPLWAFVPMLALATSMPMVAFSRAPYTEPSSLVLGVGGLVLLWLAIEAASLPLAAVSGLTIGATFASRPDGLLFVIGAVLSLDVGLLFARSADTRAAARRIMLAFIAGAALSCVFALVDLSRNSSVYEAGTWGQIRSLLIVAIAVAVVLPLLSLLPARALVGVRGVLANRRVVGARITMAVVSIAFVAMALRPLYWTAHTSQSTTSAKAVAASLARRQAAEGLPVDGTRTYDEKTLTWLSWYFSWPAVILAAAGVCVAVGWTWRRRDARLVPLLGVLGVAAALYLNRSSITPDQIWAMRRFLPIIVPVGLIFAVLLPFVVWQHWSRGRPFAILAAVILVLAPIVTWRRTLVTQEYGGAKAFTAGLCDKVRGTDVVIADQGSGGTIFLPSLRIVCGVKALLLVIPTAATLNTVRTNWNDGNPVTVVAFVPEPVPWRVVPTTATGGGLFSLWDEPLGHRPLHRAKTGDQYWLGTVATDGMVDFRAS